MPNDCPFCRAKEIRRRILLGETVSKIAQDLCCTKQNVRDQRKYLCQRNIPIPKVPRLGELALKLHHKGESIDAIAKALNKNHHQISAILTYQRRKSREQMKG